MCKSDGTAISVIQKPQEATLVSILGIFSIRQDCEAILQEHIDDAPSTG